MPDKTGMSQMQSILRACALFNIDSHFVVPLTCDNANTNTGYQIGTCVLLEEEWHTDLLWLMCRHHIYEIVLKDVYQCLFVSEAPTNIFYSNSC